MLKKFCNPFLLSITGDSGSGKSYLKKVFEDVIKDDLLTIGGDGFHRWERNHAKWGKYTHLYPKANNLGSLYRVLVKLKKFQEVTMRHYDHKKGTFYKKK
jgi:uridine kinase